MKKGFIFDLDGVLVDTATFHYKAWKALGKEVGISVDQDLNNQMKGLSRMDSLEVILRHGSNKTFYSEKEKLQLAQKKNHHYVELLKELSPANILPGALAFLQAAQLKGIPCALASASKNAPFVLEKLEIAPFFNYRVDPETLVHGKPDPEIFLRATQALNLLPADVVGFEDAQAGIDALKKADIFSVGITSGSPLIGADITVSSLTELSLDDLLQK